MCGIAGIIDRNANHLKKEIQLMTEIIAHRGPDGFGYYEGEYFAFGHRRLSIIDLTPKGAQPMKYLGRYVITYNGEIYNYIELKNELSKIGYKFYTDTDTEVIMAAFDYWGKDCLNEFNGMWAFALFDNVTNKIFCARDRFAVKPFYYTQLNGKFAFASEIKQFTVLDGWNAVANNNRVNDFLLAGGMHDHTNETLFRNVFQLQGGECLEYNLSDNSFKSSKWYSLGKNIENSSLNFEDSKQGFYQLFSDAVKLRLRSDVKVGSCLSGGLDSSSIVCIVNEMLKHGQNEINQETVSSCFKNSEIDESEYIDEVINKTGVKSHRVFPEFEDLFPTLDKMIWHQDEPFGSTAIFAQWKVYEEARKQGLIVMLDGQGADEHLAGYMSFHKMYFRELLKKFNFIRLWKSIKNYRQLYKNYYSNPYRDLIEYFFRGLLSEKLMNYLFYLVKKFKKSNSKKGNWLKISSFNDGKLNKINKLRGNTIRAESEVELLYTSLPKLLHHQDRDSMAHSIESRVPFVDYRLIEFVLGLPSSFKVANSVTKYILREAMSGILPKKIVNRYDKLGFATPESLWIKENLKTFRQEICLACDRLNVIIDKEETLKWFDEMAESKGNFGSELWTIISLSRWAKVFDVTFKS